MTETEEAEAIITAHCAVDRNHVVLAILCLQDGPDQFGVFSELEKAKAWVLSFDNRAGSILTPLILDVPTPYGRTLN